MIEEQRRKQEEARKVLEKEQMLQSEAFRKRLAEKRNKKNSPGGVGETLNLSSFYEQNEKIDSPYIGQQAATDDQHMFLRLNSCGPLNQE